MFCRLVSQGLDIKHNFLFFEDEQSEPTINNHNKTFPTQFQRHSIYLLKQNKKCDCCQRNELSMSQTSVVSSVQILDSNSLL